MIGTGQRMIVGYDGSAHAQRALRWAAVEAARRGAHLGVLAVVDEGGFGVRGPVGLAHWWPEAAVEGARRLARQGVDLATKEAPGVDAEAIGRTGMPTFVLVEASHDADLLVLGTRGRNPLAEMALGSVAERCATHAACPVVVVHHDVGAHPGPDGPILVGVDDSPGAQRALDVAAEWAHAAHAALTVMCVWNVGGAWEYDALTATEETQLESWAGKAARETVDAAVGRALHLHPDLQISGLTLPGEPAWVLAERATGAGLLVVGTRGRGAFASFVLGSVSHALVRTAPCAVTVVGGEPHAHVDADAATSATTVGSGTGGIAPH